MSRNLREIREDYEKRNGQKLTKREERERIVKRTRQKSVGENEGAAYYDEDLRYSKYGERRIYSALEIQNNINWWYGYGKFNINWNTYKTSKSYREKVNYYFFQAKHSLRDVKYLGKIDNNGEKIKISHRVGNETKIMEMNKVSEVESLYHNLEYKNGTVYLNFNGKNKKYVSKTGEEIILDENNKVVYDSAIGGTYNYYSYPVDADLWNGDKRKHKLDIELWIKYGTGPTDKTNSKLREEIVNLVLGVFITLNYNRLKKLANQENNNGKLSLKQLKTELNNSLVEISKQLTQQGGIR